MFHKEGSCTDILTSNNGGGGKGGGGGGKSRGKGKHHTPKSKLDSGPVVSKAVDVPLRKSDRRKLRQRAAAYFAGQSIASLFEDSNSNNNNLDHVDGTGTNPNETTIEALLDEIFLRGGTISSRCLPRSNSKATTNSIATESKTKGNHENLVLYVKSPSEAGNNNAASDDCSLAWPYRKKPQFVWMALEDKKSGRVIKETPSVALLAVTYHATRNDKNFDHLKNRTVTIHPPVSRYLCRGADLMRAGIVSAPEPQQDQQSATLAVGAAGNPKKNRSKEGGKQQQQQQQASLDMVAVCVKGNPQPFAVGHSILWSSNHLQANGDTKEASYGFGTKGIGVEIWNCYGDDLWRTTVAAGGLTVGEDSFFPPTLENGSYGNPGFGALETTGELCVVPLQGHEEDNEEESEPENDMECVETSEGVSAPGDAITGGETETNEIQAEDKNIGYVSPDTDSNETSTPASQLNLEEPTQCDDKSDGENHDGEKNETTLEINRNNTEDSLSPEEILHAAVCQALVNLRKNDLPMLVGTFYTKHVLTNLPSGVEGANLLKKTSYKKFGNYLKHWQMSDDDSGLVKTGPDPSNRNNKDPNALLVSFNRRHEDLHGLKKSKQQNVGESSGSSTAAGNSKIALVKLHVVPQNWTSLLRLDPDDVSATNASSEARRGTGMLTLPEAKKLLDGYLQRESSLVLSKSTVTLDAPLTDALFGKKTKEGVPEQLSRKELSKRFFGRLSPAYCLVRMPGSHVLKLGRGSPPKVQIEVVKRQSKKFVTRLRGLEEYLGGSSQLEPSEFCKNVSKRLAISGSIDSDPAASGRAALPKKGCVEYVFGANIVDELEALLTGDESLSDHGGTKGGWSFPRIPAAVIEVTLRKGVPARKRRAKR